jgi:hypothetical protein
MEMLIRVLAVLGVHLWLLLGWLAGALWHRMEINQLPDLVRAKVPVASGTYRLRISPSRRIRSDGA